MEPRLILAYSLMVLLTLMAASLIAWRWYHSRERTIARRRAAEERSRASRGDDEA